MTSRRVVLQPDVDADEAEPEPVHNAFSRASWLLWAFGDPVERPSRDRFTQQLAPDDRSATIP
jgi:hypothetical protein